MTFSRRRVAIGMALLLAFAACSTFDGESEPPAPAGDAGSEGAVDSATLDGGGDAAVCVPSTVRTTGRATCGGVPNVDLLNDPTNCGACGRTCATCTNGLCKAVAEGNASSGQGGIVIALTPTDIFLGQGAGGGVYRRPRSGASVVKLATLSASEEVHGLVVDGDRLFVAVSGGVNEVSASSDGGALPVALLSGAVDARIGFGHTTNDLFWANYFSQLVLIQKDGGNLREHGDKTGAAQSTGLAADQQAVFWIRRSSGALHEIGFRTAGGSIGRRLDGLVDPHALTMDEKHLYWISGSRRELLRATRTGTDGPVVVARWDDLGHPYVRRAVSDAKYVYWTMSSDPVNSADTLLLRAPKACDGDIVRIAQEPIESNLVLDGDHIYFANLSNVLKLPR
jgi:hypothetical protein